VRVEPGALSAVIMVGGRSQIPSVVAGVETAFGRPLIALDEPGSPPPGEPPSALARISRLRRCCANHRATKSV
jgi:hypothetical protein